MSFLYEERTSPSRFVDVVWHTLDTTDGTYLASADARWDLIFTVTGHGNRVLLSGPSSQPTVVHYTAGNRNLGIRFAAGAYFTHVPVEAMRDRTVGDHRVGADPRAGGDDGGLPDAGPGVDLRPVGDARPGAEVDVPADVHPRADHHVRVDPAAGADVGAVADYRTGLDVRGLVHGGADVHACRDLDQPAAVRVPCVRGHPAVRALDLDVPGPGLRLAA